MNEKDKWYATYMQVSLEQRYDMMVELLENPPTDDVLITDDIGLPLVDLKADIFREKRFEEGIRLINIVKQNTPNLYTKEAPYLLDSAVEYYLYNNEFDKAKEYLQPFITNPAHGLNMYIPLFNRFLFYGQTNYATYLADSVWEKVMNSDELIGGAELDFVDTIFYQNWQNYYLSRLEGKSDSEIN
ncbi:hypothetical protein ACM26V_13825 [Salipaludibacillus sp. HK11]|uniref:hypothetical protein n=1 Tax=Salipaludibacillus sp. HK11 TaxID=3394320 RepID=UPI0039FC7F52